MTKHTLFVLFVITITTFSQSYSQDRMRGGGGMPEGGPQITGKVVDKESEHAIEYANVVLYASADSSMVQGTVTDVNGTYTLKGVRRGNYYLEVRFMGYETFLMDNVRMQGPVTKLETIELVPAAIQMDEVEVAADRAPVTYQIDKKIINVERQLTATSGTAVDVLTNVPSVTVDLDGNVQLRGSGSYTVLIDGRPSALDGSEALEQIPASSIDHIEIITNPSAKYDPEGVAGIINVIMKKDGRTGLTGVFNVNVGTQDNYGADATVTQRGEWYSVYLGADYMNHGGESTSEERSVFQNENGELTINSNGTSDREYERYGVRTGADFKLSPKDDLGAGFRYGFRESASSSRQDYFEQLNDNPANEYVSIGDRSRGGGYYAADMNYEHRFEAEKHKLNAQLSFRSREGDEDTREELFDEFGNITSGRISTEDGPGRSLEGRLDYLRPLGEKTSLETGYQMDIGSSDEVTSFSEYDTLTNTYVQQTEYDRSTTYERNVHALYGLFRGEMGALGYQLGLRGEYTDRTVGAGPDGTYTIDRWDYFPTVHASYKISETQSLMASYTRRIDRPRGWYLEPFLTWMDAYNIRTGNPDLQPEYIDSYEFGYQTHIGQNMFSVEGYHRVEKNNIERIQSVYRDNIRIWRPENAGTETSSGVELMLNVDPVEFWDVYLLGNLYNYSLRGEVNGRSIDADQFTWNLRFNNTFKLTATTLLQLNARYDSEEIEPQEREEDYYVIDLALRQDLFQRKLALTLNWRDVLHSAKREHYTDAIDFTSYRSWQREAPMISLSIKYFLNTRPEPGDRNRGGDGDMGDEDF